MNAQVLLKSLIHTLIQPAVTLGLPLEHKFVTNMNRELNVILRSTVFCSFKCRQLGKQNTQKKTLRKKTKQTTTTKKPTHISSERKPYLCYLLPVFIGKYCEGLSILTALDKTRASVAHVPFVFALC